MTTIQGRRSSRNSAARSSSTACAPRKKASSNCLCIRPAETPRADASAAEESSRTPSHPNPRSDVPSKRRWSGVNAGPIVWQDIAAGIPDSRA